MFENKNITFKQTITFTISRHGISYLSNTLNVMPLPLHRGDHALGDRLALLVHVLHTLPVHRFTFAGALGLYSCGGSGGLV